MTGITVLVTHLDDPRVLATLDSLAQQHVAPDQVLVADGGSQPALLDRIRAHPCPGLQLLDAPGSVAASRATAMHHVAHDVLVFLDADEVAPPKWSQVITDPIKGGDADVVGGPTRPHAPPASRAEAYVNDFDAWFYDHIVAADAAKLPMGNSAWRTSLVRDIGGFDARLGWGGEDYDVNLRARAAGARFAYAPDAWVYHDQSHLDTVGKLWRRMRKYSKGATMAYRKNGTLLERSGRTATQKPFRHGYQPLLLTAKAVGLIDGLRAWHRLNK